MVAAAVKIVTRRCAPSPCSISTFFLARRYGVSAGNLVITLPDDFHCSRFFKRSSCGYESMGAEIC
jgi:hypothetical protein